MKELKFMWLNLIYFLVYYEDSGVINTVAAIGHKEKEVIVVRPEHRLALDGIKTVIRRTIPLYSPKVLWGDAFRVDTWDEVIKKYEPSEVSDFIFIDDGSICLLKPQTPEARKWVEGFVSLDDWQSKSKIAIEPRYASDILEGIRTSGFTIEEG